MDLISVIVPVYKVENYIRDCIDSILCQSYSNIELILVDDGSPDSSGDICDEYASLYKDNVKVIHSSNRGVTNARLLGVSIALGSWIGFVDGDDIIEKDMYSKLIKNANQYNSDISHCGYQTIVNGGERVHYFYNTGRTIVQDKIGALSDLILGEFIEPSLCNKLFKKVLFDKIINTNILDCSIKYNEDLLMNYILFSQCSKAIYEDFCPYHYMARETSATRKEININRIIDPMKVREWIYINSDEQLKKIALRKYLLACYNAYSSLIDIKEYEKEKGDIKKTLLIYRKNWNVLKKKEYIKVLATLYIPRLYRVIYNVYEKYVQKKVYE